MRARTPPTISVSQVLSPSEARRVSARRYKQDLANIQVAGNKRIFPTVVSPLKRPQTSLQHRQTPNSQLAPALIRTRKNFALKRRSGSRGRSRSPMRQRKVSHASSWEEYWTESARDHLGEWQEKMLQRDYSKGMRRENSHLFSISLKPYDGKNRVRCRSPILQRMRAKTPFDETEAFHVRPVDLEGTEALSMTNTTYEKSRW